MASSAGKPSSWITKTRPAPRLILIDKFVLTGPFGPMRRRGATSTHCRTLPSGPTWGTALQTPCGKRTCCPATGFASGAARAGSAVAIRQAAVGAKRAKELVMMRLENVGNPHWTMRPAQRFIPARTVKERNRSLPVLWGPPAEEHHHDLRDANPHHRPPDARAARPGRDCESGTAGGRLRGQGRRRRSPRMAPHRSRHEDHARAFPGLARKTPPRPILGRHPVP